MYKYTYKYPCATWLQCSFFDFIEYNAMTFQPDSNEADLSYFAPDCFHLSEKGHKCAAEALWNNMVPVVVLPISNSIYSLSYIWQCVVYLNFSVFLWCIILDWTRGTEEVKVDSKGGDRMPQCCVLPTTYNYLLSNFAKIFRAKIVPKNENTTKR